MNDLFYDNYTIIINRSFECGVDYTIIDSRNDNIIACNHNYTNWSEQTLNDFFNYIIEIIKKYEKERKENNV